jgi:hypothetical protein
LALWRERSRGFLRPNWRICAARVRHGVMAFNLLKLRLSPPFRGDPGARQD